jgi:hypothetical protein
VVVYEEHNNPDRDVGIPTGLSEAKYRRTVALRSTQLCFEVKLESLESVFFAVL